MNIRKPIAGSRNFLSKVFQARETSIFFFIIVLIVLVSLRTTNFLNIQNFGDILLDISILAIVAIGQMMVIITTGIDLSIGSGLALSAMAVGSIVRANWDISPLLAVLIGAGIGVFLGTINGLVINHMKIPPIITTLGTLSMYRGLVYVVSGGTWVAAHQISPEFKAFSIRSIAGLPFLVFLAIVISIIFYIFLNHINIGRQIYAIGNNLTAARLAGIRTGRITLLVYVLSGFLYGIAGVMWVSRYAIAANNTASGLELQTVAACVVGGVGVSGGSGNVVGLLLGTLMIGIINNAVNLVGISPFWKQAFYGFVILLAVIADAAMTKRLHVQNQD